MVRKFRYNVEIKDPEKAESDRAAGHASGDLTIIDKSGKERGLTRHERAKYDAARNGYDDMDFNAPYDRKTELIFRIHTNSKWCFQDPPFEVRSRDFTKNERHCTNKKEARLYINGHGSHDDTIKHYYKILYQNETGGEKWEHDPIISSGSVPPTTGN